jgi:hypothetical protein
VLAELMLAALLCLAMLPIAFLQTRVLFNSVYAGALDTIAARRHLESYVYSQINLAGLWRLCLSIGQQSVEVLGWVLGLFGLRQVVTGLLRRTWCWRYFEAPVRRNALPRTPAWQTPGRYSRQVLQAGTQQLLICSNLALAQVDTTYTHRAPRHPKPNPNPNPNPSPRPNPSPNPNPSPSPNPLPNRPTRRTPCSTTPRAAASYPPQALRTGLTVPPSLPCWQPTSSPSCAGRSATDGSNPRVDSHTAQDCVARGH